MPLMELFISNYHKRHLCIASLTENDITHPSLGKDVLGLIETVEE